MNFITARNRLIAALSKAVGHPVVLSDQVQPEQERPFIIYSVLSPYGPTGSLGDYSHTATGDGDLTETRTEQPIATFSFTVCSVNRWAKVKGSRKREYIFGDDEAQSIANTAQGWLLHGGYDEIGRMGFVVVEILNASGRTALIIDEADRQYGFDARLRYVRTDERTVSTVEQVPVYQNKKE